VEVLPADLSDPDDLYRVEKYAAAKENLEVLVNNAGFGIPGLFAETEINTTMTMVNVHVIASVRLTRAVLPAMIERDRGFVIQVSSISAFNSSTGSPTYGATKAYLNAFTDGLVTELFGTGVHVQALCPGFTHTEFHDSEKYDKFRVKERIPAIMWMDCDVVVRASLRNVFKRGGIYVPGLGNKVIAFLGAVGIVRGAIHLYQSLFHRGPISS
jgi:short-subunit dehydrogenase